MMLNKRKFILIISAFLMAITILTLNLKNVYSVENVDDGEYKQYVISWIDEFAKIQNENPIIFTIKTEYLDQNRENMQLRIRAINKFNYPEDRVPEKYKEMHKELIQILQTYKEAYEGLYLAITSGDSKSVGTEVQRLYQSDVALTRIKNELD